MKKKINNIIVDNYKRKKFLKNEIKKKILKSIMQNLNIKPKIRSNALKKLTKININSSISKQNNNICLKSGRFKGVLRKTNLCRHEMKKLGSIGSLQNISIKSW